MRISFRLSSYPHLITYREHMSPRRGPRSVELVQRRSKSNSIEVTSSVWVVKGNICYDQRRPQSISGNYQSAFNNPLTSLCKPVGGPPNHPRLYKITTANALPQWPGIIFPLQLLPQDSSTRSSSFGTITSDKLCGQLSWNQDPDLVNSPHYQFSKASEIMTTSIVCLI